MGNILDFTPPYHWQASQRGRAIDGPSTWIQAIASFRGRIQKRFRVSSSSTQDRSHQATSIFHLPWLSRPQRQSWRKFNKCRKFSYSYYNCKQLWSRNRRQSTAHEWASVAHFLLWGWVHDYGWHNLNILVEIHAQKSPASVIVASPISTTSSVTIVSQGSDDAVDSCTGVSVSHNRLSLPLNFVN